MTRARALVVALLVAATWGGVADAGSAPRSSTCYRPPVASPITVGFEAPPCPYCSGRRGVGYRLPPGTTVVAVAAGEVTFAGRVAGVAWVVVAHADGRRASYGHVTSMLVRVGQTVRTGQPLALSGSWLHLGIRVGDEYVDPSTLLGTWVGRPRLIPSNGAPPRPAPAPRLACPAP